MFSGAGVLFKKIIISLKFNNNKMITETDFRNYAWDVEGIDTGTPSGLGRYLEWLEELMCDEEKLNKVKSDIKERKEWFKSSIFKK